MKIAVVLILLVVAVLVLRQLRSSGASSKKTRASARRRPARVSASAGAQAAEPFRAVSLQCGPQACEQALALENRRFLPGKLGKLPLPGCTEPGCTCKFIHHSDRRDGQGEKRAPSGLSTELYHASGKPNRRTRKGRRKDDFH